ncbi:bZIP transcription factor 50 [Hordeum vulgare subsp. vulgare]|uniref:Predicted protein n=2 Tax=Hordeum vulgare subsp. vulgare TaxID=112509 RepID=F2DNN7_HORVV|nr:bZIP transcription factor 50 [Hordeum vulgare subsp. vulgare]BAJ96708.1 predicted protein [Hordeum vulgare subsp. vulgare]BAJ97531.1 predicted protein [Hordeum vulgare subsp. vulgare]BAK01158.1 predicted protein [Hordeum vulgare subsp. vulgare]BAK01350.1 predicted protein [Hordeum vulgare subsp. vulgare]
MDADLDLDALLATFAADSAVSELLAPPPHLDAEAGSPESVTSRSSPAGEEALSEIERFLMQEEEAAGVEPVDGISVDEFIDALFDGAEEGGEKGNGSEAEAGGSTDGDSRRGDEEGVEVVTPETEVDGDDPISKKKRRQMRNRDSAMKSRERKKSYVKDLETKSKYLEAECRRLSYALQCCAAENMALRQNMLKDRPIGAHTVMQESAVLMETLPLVSLLCLVSIVCLFLTPGLPNRSLVAPRRAERDLAMVAGKPSSDQPETLELLLHGRRWRGTRERIKLDILPLRAAAAC